MSQQELLTALAAFLESEGIPYFVTGSIASSLQGEPRATHDIDLVVALPEAAIAKMAAAFPSPRFHMDERADREALRRQEMFNLIDTDSGIKADLWPLTGDAFDQSRIARRTPVDAGGFRLWVSSPEDTILAKLRWTELSGGSEKQFRDALRVYEVQGRALDAAYLDRWADTLGITAWLTRLRHEAEPL